MLYRFYNRPLRCGIVIVPLALLGFLIAGCAGSQESAPPVAGSFVGEAPDADAFVAVVADNPDQGGEGREVRAYLCDAKQIIEWFKGSITGNELDLSSDHNDAHLTGELTREAASGTVTLPDGKSVPFEAEPATGIAGLYEVTYYGDGRVSGTSERSAQLEGEVADRPVSERYLVTGTITPPDGQPQGFEMYIPTAAQPGEFRQIFLSDGSNLGWPKPRGATEQPPHTANVSIGPGGGPHFQGGP